LEMCGPFAVPAIGSFRRAAAGSMRRSLSDFNRIVSDHLRARRVPTVIEAVQYGPGREKDRHYSESRQQRCPPAELPESDPGNPDSQAAFPQNPAIVVGRPLSDLCPSFAKKETSQGPCERPQPIRVDQTADCGQEIVDLQMDEPEIPRPFLDEEPAIDQTLVKGLAEPATFIHSASFTRPAQCHVPVVREEDSLADFSNIGRGGFPEHAVSV